MFNFAHRKLIYKRMVLPIIAYGNPVLRKVGIPITTEYPHLKTLIDNMWETMYNSNGVGLAAPQINHAIRLFIIDSGQVIKGLEEDEKDSFPGDEGYKGVFINAEIVEENGEEWPYNEGCLSIPKIREDILRKETVTLHFMDEHFIEHTQTFVGVTARIILHEYDHIEGKLFIDYLKPLKKNLLKRKLNDISTGKIQVDYKMAFNK